MKRRNKNFKRTVNDRKILRSKKIFKGILVIFLKRLYGKRYYLFYYFYLYVLKWFVPKKIGKMTKSGQVWAIGFIISISISISMMSIFFGHRHASLCPILCASQFNRLNGNEKPYNRDTSLWECVHHIRCSCLSLGWSGFHYTPIDVHHS